MSVLKITQAKKYPIVPFIVGFGVACVHFLITPLFEGSFILLLMLAPGYIPIVAISFLEFFSIYIDYSNFDAALLETLHQLFSSLFYGVLAGIFAGALLSNNHKLRWAAIIILALIIYFGCSLLILAGQSFA